MTAHHPLPFGCYLLIAAFVVAILLIQLGRRRAARRDDRPLSRERKP